MDLARLHKGPAGPSSRTAYQPAGPMFKRSEYGRGTPAGGLPGSKKGRRRSGMFAGGGGGNPLAADGMFAGGGGKCLSPVYGASRAAVIGPPVEGGLVPGVNWSKS